MNQRREKVVSTLAEIKPDVDYLAMTQRANSRPKSATAVSRKSSVKRALATLGNMPELRHPQPQRPTYHEILVQGYGNGTNNVNFTTERPATAPLEEVPRKTSSDSGSSSCDMSSQWSNSSYKGNVDGSVGTAASSVSMSRRGSDSSFDKKTSIRDLLDRSLSSMGLPRPSSSIYSAGSHESLQPDPLQVKRLSPTGKKHKYQGSILNWEEEISGRANDDLMAYLHTKL